VAEADAKIINVAWAEETHGPQLRWGRPVRRGWGGKSLLTVSSPAKFRDLALSKHRRGPRPRWRVLESKFELLMLRSLEHAGPALERIVADGLQRVQGGQGPIVAWPLVCGTAVAQRTRALDFGDGVLQVEVPDAGWRNELRTLASQYLAVINRYVSEPVKRIEFVVAGTGQKPVPTLD
jgi:hypothetical protein